MTGYKTMLRNNLSTPMNLALLWCKAKDKWINHVYDNFIGIYVDKENRKRATCFMIKEQNFDSTIDWDNSLNDEVDFWKYVSTWVTWFRTNYSKGLKNVDISFLPEEERKLFTRFISKWK